MCLLTELGRAGQENIWLEVMPYGLSVASEQPTIVDILFE